MGKSYKKKQYTRREGLYSERTDKDNTPGVHKKGKVWVDDDDSSDDGEDFNMGDDEDGRNRWARWDPYDDDMGPIYDEGQSIFIGSAELTSI